MNNRSTKSVDSSTEYAVFDIFKSPHSNSQQNKTPQHNFKRKTPKRKLPEEEDLDRRQRPRTPSGQYQFNPISELKTKLFNQPTSASAKTLNTIKEALPLSVNNLTAISPVDLTDYSTYTSFITHVKKMSGKEVNECETAETMEVQTTISENVNRSIGCDKEFETPKASNLTPKKQSVMDKYINDAIQQSGLSSLEEADKPVTMDIRTVIQMVEDMKIELKEEISAQIQKSFQQMQTSLPTNDVARLDAKLQVSEAKERMIVDTMAYMSDQMKNPDG